MKLEQQVTSLDISKRLKELGVKQESLFWHFFDSAEGDGLKELEPLTMREIQEDELDKDEEIEIFSAFTVAELGEMLPSLMIDGEKTWFLRTSKFTSGKKPTWFCTYKDDINKKYLHFSDTTEADARGKMLIYLLENKLIPCP